MIDVCVVVRERGYNRRPHEVCKEAERRRDTAGGGDGDGDVPTYTLGGPPNELHCAAEDGSTEHTVALLSDGKIHINQGDLEGRIPLMDCCFQGYVRVTRILLREGADVSIADDEGWTALHISAKYGRLAVTRLLLKAGAELKALDRGGNTPLYLCSYDTHTGVLSALLEAGANTTAKTSARIRRWCKWPGGHLDAVKTLLHAKADPVLGDLSDPPRVSLGMAAGRGAL